MRRKLLYLLLVGLCLLPGCGRKEGGDAESLALTIRSELIAMTGLSGRAEITVDEGEMVYSFVLDIAYDSGAGAVLTVVEPEIIAGLAARIQADGATIAYDGASLEIGPLPGGGTSPIEVLPLLLSQARTGYIAESVFETDGTVETLRMTCTDAPNSAGSGTQVVLWFDRVAHTPLRAEIFSEGTRVMTCILSGIERTT